MKKEQKQTKKQYKAPELNISDWQNKMKEEGYSDADITTMLSNLERSLKQQKEMIKPQTWDAFKDAGLLQYVNMIINAFGWAIVLSVDKEKKINGVFPARTKFRGFDNQSTQHAYKALTQFLKENADELLEEASTPNH